MTSPHVIIIDDDSAVRASLCALLEAFDYDVSSFDSAEAFLAADSSPERACLLLDIQLPGMNGCELQKKLKQERVQLPIILISGYADSALISGAVEDGAVAVLEKPLDSRVLFEHIERALRIKSRG